jgi:DNA-binding NarL/FixJ family response regulator/class 3 adenylate cyclase
VAIWLRETATMVWLATVHLPSLLLLVPPAAAAGRRPARSRLTFMYVVPAVVGAAAVLAGGSRGPGVVAVATNAAHPMPTTLARVLYDVHLGMLLAGAVAVLTACTRRLARRRTMLDLQRPLLICMIVWVIVVVSRQVVGLLPVHVLFGVAGNLRDWSTSVLLLMPALALNALVGATAYLVLVRPRLLRPRDGSLVVATDPVDGLESRLRRWLSDPTARLAFADTSGAWVDNTGRPVQSAVGPERATTTLTRSGEVVGRIEHAADLASVAGSLETAAASAALAIEASRQIAIANSAVLEARQLASRLLRADELEQRAFAAELDSGAVGALRDLGQRVRRGLPLDEASAELRQITAELRRLSHGLMPPELVTGGLRAALPDGRGVPSERLPSVVEVTAYQLAKDDRNASFSIRDGLLVIELSKPPADAAAIDRVVALGGVLNGTVVTMPIEVGYVQTTTILFTDVVDSTRAMTDADDDTSAARLFTGILVATREVVARYNGRVVKSLGDGAMALFDSAYDAVRATIALHQRAELDGRRQGSALRLRIGVHVGEVTTADVVEQGDVFGAAVVTARRLCDAGGAGETIVSDLVARLVGVRADVRFESPRRVKLKGLDDALDVVSVPWDPVPAERPLRVVVADDAALISAGLTRLLSDEGFDVTATVGDYDALLQAVKADPPDLVITDIRMPPTLTDEGLRAAAVIRSMYPEMAVVVLSQHIESAAAASLMAGNVGALGYLLKERVSAVDEFVAACRAVCSGGTVIDPMVAEMLVRRRRDNDAIDRLSTREREVLTLMAQGRSNRAIATELICSDKTVESHVRSIFTKLDLPEDPDEHRRVAAVVRWLEATR